MSPSRAHYYGLLAIAAMLLAWHLASTFWLNPFLFPPPDVVARAFVRMLRTGELFNHIGVSLTRVLIGFVVGAVLGTMIGLLMGQSRIIRGLIDPIVELLRSVSPVSLIPLAMLWFGIGEVSKLFIIMYTALIVVTLNTVAGVASVPLIRLRAARCLGAGRTAIFLKVVLPSAWPYILVGMRVALGLSFTGVVAAEIVAAEVGVGYLIMAARVMVQTERMYVGLIVLGLLGLLSDRTFRYLIRRTMKRYMLEIAR